MTKLDYLNEEEITASKVALAVSASIGSGGECPDKWVMEWLLKLTEKRLKAIKAERIAETNGDCATSQQCAVCHGEAKNYVSKGGCGITQMLWLCDAHNEPHTGIKPPEEKE